MAVTEFLLEIDPRSLEGQLQRGEASVAAARSSLQQARTAVEQTRVTLDLARQNLKRQDELWKEGLTSRESLERADNEVAVREAPEMIRNDNGEPAGYVYVFLRGITAPESGRPTGWS